MPQFYAVMLEWAEQSYGYFRVFWAWGSHLGEAIEKVQHCAARLGIEHAIPCQADPYEHRDLPASATTDDAGATYISDTAFRFPPEAKYRLPAGVIASVSEGEHEVRDIQLGYRITQNTGGLYTLTAVVPAEQLVALYGAWLAITGDLRVAWIEFQEDWQPITDERFFVNEELAHPDAIMSFLLQYQIDTILNGHVTITSYTEVGETNLSITDHKLLRAVGYDVNLIQRLTQPLIESGLPVIDKLITVERGIYHWHYRQSGSRSRSQLIDLLQDNHFVAWQPE